MNKKLKILLFSASLVLIVFLGFRLYKYHSYQQTIEQYNICQDDVLIYKLIENNINPFSKFKFIKK